MRCPFCGSSLESNAKYCNDCGTAVDSVCSGKNINYRSYIDTRPQASDAPKTPTYRVRENNAAPKTAQTTSTEKKIPFGGNVQNVPNVTPGQFGQFKGNNAKPAKKNGCAIVFVIIFMVFASWGVIGSLIENFDFSSTFSTEPESEYNYEYDYDNNYSDLYVDDDGFANDAIGGRTDGNYYLNDYVNFALAIPDGFNEQSAFGIDYALDIIPDCFFENDDGDYILVGFSEEINSLAFLTQYINEVYSSMNDSDLDCEISVPTDKQVGNNSFATQSVSRSDGRTVDIYVCHVDDLVFFVEINTSSAELNKTVSESFVNSYASF